MPITTLNPRPVENAEIEYDMFLIDLSVSPQLVGNTVEGIASLRLIPYRVLPGDVLDVRYDLAVTEVHQHLFAAAAADANLGQLVTSVLTAIQTYVTAKEI
jgi:hypothetical protein